MENKSDDLQHEHGMPDQTSRPFTSLLLSATSVAQAAQQDTGSDIKSLSLLHGSSLLPPDDGYIWKARAQNIVPGCEYPTMYYKCAQDNCNTNKLVVCSADGHQVLETVLSGCHNHPRQQDCDLPIPKVSKTDTSMPVSREGDDEQLSSSSDSDEDDVDQARVEGDGSVTRHVPHPAERITAQTGTANSHRHAGRRRPKSKVWEEFSAVLRDDKIQWAECKHCKMSLGGTSTGRTTHLRRHLKICPALPATDRMQKQRSSPHPGSTIESIWKFDQDRSLELLIKVLVSNLFSSPLTSSTTFRQLWAGICPTNDVVSDTAIEEKFLSIFENEKLKLKEEIALAPGGVFLTAASSSLETKNFIFLTVHFIDKEWNLNRKIIRCCFTGCEDFDAEYFVSMFPNLQSCHNFINGNVRAAEEEIVKEAVQNWRLEWKLLGISSRKSLADAAVLALEKNLTEQNYLLAKCKLLNLPCIIDALNDLFGYEINEYVLSTSKMWFQYMTCTPLRRDKYKEILSRLQINRPSFGSQRWYLIFHSLEAALQFNNELPDPQQIDSRYYPAKPSFAQLKAAENFCDLVRAIYHAVKVVSRTCNGALNSQFHAVWNLKMALLRSSTKEDIDQVFNIEQMKLKFDQLWRKWYLWLSLAVVLDPRYKFRFLLVCFKEAFGSHAKRYIFEVRGKLYELFLQYSCHVDQQNSDSFDQRTNDLQLDTHDSTPVHAASQNFIEQAAHEELGEVIRYLEAELIPQNANFDILKWWKENALTYPALARLACDILAIPGSAVSAESAFDETDERVGLFNLKLSPELVEALVCTQDWIKSSEIISDEVGGNINMPA